MQVDTTDGGFLTGRRTVYIQPPNELLLDDPQNNGANT